LSKEFEVIKKSIFNKKRSYSIRQRVDRGKDFQKAINNFHEFKIEHLSNTYFLPPTVHKFANCHASLPKIRENGIATRVGDVHTRGEYSTYIR